MTSSWSNDKGGEDGGNKPWAGNGDAEDEGMDGFRLRYNPSLLPPTYA